MTAQFDLVTVFPHARAIGVNDDPGWHVTPLIETAARSWVESGAADEHAAFDPRQDVAGPVVIGRALEREREDGRQRIAVIGSGDFLANAYLGNGGNLDLGINLVNWLAGDANLITIQPKNTMDATLSLGKSAAMALALGLSDRLCPCCFSAPRFLSGAAAMPELPEVETTCRGLEPHLSGQRIRAVIVRDARLRFPVMPELAHILPGLVIRGIDRRGKYLLLDCGQGWLILHLGMSGSLRILPAATPAEKHDHFDLVLENGFCMRLRDPRRFGAVIWTETDPLRHPLLANLGVEPLTSDFDGAWLYRMTRGKKSNIKQTLMDGHLLVGVGNIYANEALFRAGIKPSYAGRAASGRQRCDRLAQAVKEVLQQAIAAGGSSLRDFVDSSGKPGYFQQQYFVYGRAGEPCRQCGVAHPLVAAGAALDFLLPRLPALVARKLHAA